MENPILKYPNFDEKFILETDASSQGLGAVLSQTKDGLLHLLVDLCPRQRRTIA